MEFDYTVTTTKTFDEAVAAVQEEVVKQGMRVLHVHDMQQLLADKGFHRDPMKLIEVCHAKYSYEFLEAEIMIGLCMPCKINVYPKDGQIHISGMRPIVLPQFFPNVDLGEKPSEIDQILRTIIDNAK